MWRRLQLARRRAYGTSEAFRFADGPIDDEDGPEGQLNAWPMDEAYLDYVEGDAGAGIINTTSIALSKASHFLAGELARRGIPNAEVRADVEVAMNGRRRRRLIDPTVDLAREPFRWGSYAWILR